MTSRYDPYKFIAQEYDLIMGQRDEIKLLKKLVPRVHPKAETILELACGTGKLLKPFSSKYTVSGLDYSKPMLNLAKKSMPKGTFYKADMTKFQLSKKFDVILCLFNSINHLKNFTEWKLTFKSVANHLEKEGVFIFDINTKAALRGYFLDVNIEKTKNSTIITEYSDFEDGNLLMHISIFQKKRNGLFEFKESKIYERAYPVNDIVKALKQHFKKIKIIDPYRKLHNKQSEVLYFVCS